MKKIFTLISAIMLCSSVAMAQEPIYLLDFENATTVADFGGIQHGSGAIATSTNAKFGKYYQNWPKPTAPATAVVNYLEVVPTTNPWATIRENNAFTISFWCNASVAVDNSIDSYWGSLFTGYTAAGTKENRTWWYPVGPDLRFAGQYHHNNGGWSDTNVDDYRDNIVTWRNDKAWHHFAWVFSNVGTETSFNLALFLDGTQKYSITLPVSGTEAQSAFMLADLDRFVIGGASPIYAGDPDNAFAYDDIAFYSSALTKDQIDAIITAKTSTSGVETIKTAKPAKAVRYNLAGQQVNGSYKGVVIENGRKVVIK